MRLWISGMLAAVALTACTVPDQVELYNNTGSGVVVTACGRPERLGSGLSFRADLCGGIVLVETDVTRWIYRTLPLNWGNDVLVKYGSRTTIGNRLLKLQLEPDGSVLLVAPTRQYPIAAELPQPAGFPVTPTEIGRT